MCQPTGINSVKHAHVHACTRQTAHLLQDLPLPCLFVSAPATKAVVAAAACVGCTPQAISHTRLRVKSGISGQLLGNGLKLLNR